MTSPRDSQPRSWTHKTLLDEWQRQGELEERAPDHLLSALMDELAGARPPAPHELESLRRILSRRMGVAATSPAATAPEPPARPAQPGQTGEAYLELLARLDPQAARDGQVFTPWRVALHLAELLDPAPGQRWLDPAAGAGIFLQAAASRGADLSTCWALEPDPAAAALGRVLTPGASWHGGDALAAWNGLPADWRGGFDRVILNPPYRNGVERRDPLWVTRRQELKERFTTARGPFDLYVPFVERALEFVRPGGRLGFLLPTSWLASRYGRILRMLLAERTELRVLQHAPGCRLVSRANVDLLLLVVAIPGAGAPRDTPLRVERLDRALACQESHQASQAAVRHLAEEGWGPLLSPPARRRMRPLTPPLGSRHPVMASLSASEYYSLEVREGGAPAAGDLLLLSSGALEPYHHTWGTLPVRFRGGRLACPVVRAETLAPSRRRQVATPRVLIANLSRRLEALVLPPDTALGVVNVIQVLCADLDEAFALAAWLNSSPLQEVVCTWHDPLRMNRQLSLTRGLVAGLPAPPRAARGGAARDAGSLAELGRALTCWAEEGALDSAGALAARAEVDRIAARHLPLGPDLVSFA